MEFEKTLEKARKIPNFSNISLGAKELDYCMELNNSGKFFEAILYAFAKGADRGYRAKAREQQRRP